MTAEGKLKNNKGRTTNPNLPYTKSKTIDKENKGVEFHFK